MYFESYKSILYSDTLVPDIFVTEYMPSMDCDFVKIYLYCLFLSKYNKQAATEELSKKLGIDISKVKDGLIYLEGIGVITRKENGIVITDLKEKEIKKMYRLKATSTPEEAALSSERNKKRNNIISAINNTFFQGLMSPSWYTDLDAWFDKYQFEEDVMYTLFKHCYDHNGLAKNYIMKVADNWHNKNIRNSFDLDRYFIEYQKLKDIRLKIVKKLKLARNLTEYEEEYIEKWVMDYKYDFDIIELSLKKTTSKTNPNFNYINSILASWNEKNLKTKEDIINYEKARRQSAPHKQQKEAAVPQRDNFDQRQYDDEYYNKFFSNTGN
jgi:DnaD/phage-associated family protein